MAARLAGNSEPDEPASRTDASIGNAHITNAHAFFGTTKPMGISPREQDSTYLESAVWRLISSTSSPSEKKPAHDPFP